MLLSLYQQPDNDDDNDFGDDDNTKESDKKTGMNLRS